MYFLVPLMVILVTPALEGLLPQWREAAENLGASAWQYWRHVALPVLAPRVRGATWCCSATPSPPTPPPLALTSGSIPLVPPPIADALSGNVLAGRRTSALALGLTWSSSIAVVMVGYLPAAAAERAMARR